MFHRERGRGGGRGRGRGNNNSGRGRDNNGGRNQQRFASKSVPTTNNNQRKSWFLMSVGCNLKTEEEKEFIDDFIKSMRDDGYDLKEPMHRIQTLTKDEAKTEISKFIGSPEGRHASICVVITQNLNRDMADEFIQQYRGRLRIFNLACGQVRQALDKEDAMDRLVGQFVKVCNINKENNDETKQSTSAKKEIFPIAISHLIELCEKLDSGQIEPNSSDLIRQLTLDGGRFFATLDCCQNKDKPYGKAEFVDRMVKLVAALCEYNYSQFKEMIQELLQKVIDSGLLSAACKSRIEPLEWEISGLSQRDAQNIRKAVKHLLLVMIAVLERFPSQMQSVGPSCSTILRILTKDEIMNERAFRDEEMKKLLDRLEVVWNGAVDLKKSTKRPETKRSSPKLKNETEPPPNDFRLIPICPTKEDIVNNEKPYYRRNVVKGAYENSEHYLDVQFRLLREDFVAPLREGIREFLTANSRRVGGVYIYRNVEIDAPKIDRKTGVMTHMAKIQTTKRVRWVKRLLHGSLVCLSCDNFQNDLVFATVHDRSPESLQKGEVFLSFEFLGQAGLVNHNTKYVMVESSAYFQAYRHVLRGLQAFKVNVPLPFEDYLVYCRAADMEPPSYLVEQREFDFGVLLKNNDGAVARPKSFICDVFDLQNWPTKEQLGLDKSQYDALQLTLTSELAMIQGPPGTGKTFIGHLLTKLLIENESAWNEDNKHPILVVCYTNHALDQFLEGIADFLSDGIIRIGGQCKSEKLQDFRLPIVRQQKRTRLPPGLGRALYDCRQTQGDLQRQIDVVAAALKRVDKQLPRLAVLKFHMSPEHQRWFQKEDDLQHWLVTPPQGGIITNAQQHMNVQLVRELMLHGFPEQIAKKASFLSGNRDLLRAQQWIIQNLQHPEFLNPIEGTANWPLMEHVEELVQMGFIEEEVVLALETGRTIPAAVDILAQPRPQQNNVALEQRVQQRPQQPNDSDSDDDDYLEAFEDFEDRLLDDDIQFLPEEHFQNGGTEKDVANMFVSNQQQDQDSGWETVGPSRLDRCRAQILAERPLREADVDATLDVWRLPLKTRWRLFMFWVAKFRVQLENDLRDKEKKYGLLSQKIREIQQMGDLELLKTAKVLGMTTTGAATNQALLQDIQPRIVIMEEAAEVLEAHLVTSLSRGCEHVILIGDHQQLRPNPAVYELAKNYGLDVSLFERLIKNDFEHAQLKLQHRMRPEISRTLMPHFYPDLQDDKSVSNYEDVRGLQKNMVFINHSNHERSEEDSKSHRNDFEANFATGICRYLMQQDYKDDQVTVLCTYLDQMFAIKKAFKLNNVEGIRVTVVDNYQGEECDVIILSLVRSNNEDNIGFLKVPNRVCVAFSRAKKGFICIGNLDHMVQSSGGKNQTPWDDIVSDLISKGYMRNTLPIVCQLHEVEQEVSCLADFKKLSPEGGCRKPCNARMECGHCCEKPCHAYDLEHKAMKCTKPCGRQCIAEHPCKKLCYQPCGNCMEQVWKLLLCGHKRKTNCYLDPEDITCIEKCTKTLASCGHKCAERCSQPCTAQCKVLLARKLKCGHNVQASCYKSIANIACNERVEKSWPHCGHKIKVPCHIDPLFELCPQPCREPLPGCDHICKGTCGNCRQGRLHIRCTEDCRRILICGHQCKSKCCKTCPPCTERCETRCQHSVCGAKAKKRKGRLCGEPCPPCMEECGWHCDHSRCDLKCFQPCQRDPCSEPCEKLLTCKHPCIGVCGEKCPDVCQTCNPEKMAELREIFFGYEEEEDARFIQLEDCGHIYEMQGIDHLIKTQADNKQTEGDTEDGDVQPQQSQEIELLSCPKCKVPIRKSLRFGKHLKQRISDIDQIKLTIIGNTKEELDSKRDRLLIGLEQFKATMEADAALVKYADIWRAFRPLHTQLVTIIGKPDMKDLTLEKLNGWKNILQLFKRLGSFELETLANLRGTLKVSLITKHRSTPLGKLANDYFDGSFIDWLDREHKFLVGWLSSNLKDHSNLMLEQFSAEIVRFELMSQLASVMYSAMDCDFTQLNSSDYKKMEIILTTLYGNKSVNENITNQVDDVVKDWTAKVDVIPGLAVTRKEVVMIQQAVSMGAGHWYKCPNGHIYVIGECGGAMQRAKCPECKAVIGGEHHALERTNERADDLIMGQPFYDARNG